MNLTADFGDTNAILSRTAFGIAHPQSLQCAADCRLRWETSYRRQWRLSPLQAETCYRWKPATGVGNLLQAFSVLSGVWRSVLHRDKGGRRPGRDAFRGGSPRKLSNGRKSVPSQPLKSSKSHNSHTHQPAPFDPYIQFVLEN